MKRILVLCTGNACRSQMAEAYLNYFATEEVDVHSAGLTAKGVHPLAIHIMKEDNIDISQAESKDVSHYSSQHFDFVITLCEHAKRFQPMDISATHYFHFEVPDPEANQFEAIEPYEVFYNTRELVKKEILRFIGKYLKTSVPPEREPAS